MESMPFFYQSYWDMIGEDVTGVCLGVLNNGEDVGPLNKTLVALIPKTSKPEKMEEYRPISLCNVINKIIAKAIANRLKKVLDSIISPTQSDFVPGRMITDNVVIGFECIHTINSRKKGKNRIATLKLDMSKAYDKVEWLFLR